ncbi:MAG: hypothetical protein JSU89_07150 [Myxococcales bacterium]|nr:MAG: hypothetical protein JSU89_07150 [Myxococcales bacterium]
MTQEQKNMVLERRKSTKDARKRAEGLWWAGALIWAGLVFGADSLDLLPQVGGADAWSWVFLGAGAYGLLSDLYYLRSESAYKPTTWDWIWSGGLTLVGLGGFTTIDISWPLILILIGAAILVNQYVRRP